MPGLSPSPCTTPNTLPKPSHRRTTSFITPGASRNSSLQQVWAEDYFTDDFPGELSFDADPIRGPSPPPPAALTSRPFPRSIPLTADEESHTTRQPRTHQRSLTALLPFRSSNSANTSPQRSPIREISTKEYEDEFMPTLTGDRDGVIKVADKRPGGLASWFSGSSAQVQVGISVMEQDTTSPGSREELPERQPAKLQKRPTLPTLDSSSSTNTNILSKSALTSGASSSMFNFFSSPKTPSKQTVQLPAELNMDEYLTLDIKSALFPTSSPSDRDPFSPAAFKNLLMNAEGLLTKLQHAYKVRTLSLHELSAEKEAMSEELEEAETRAKCLRSQLEDMAARVSEQDSSIIELANELAQEKQARAEEKEAREKSIALIRANSQSQRPSHIDLDMVSPMEDLGIANAASPREERKKWRISGGSTDMSGESDAESGGAESVFSRSRSPTLTLNSMSESGRASIMSTPEIQQAAFGRVVHVRGPSISPGYPSIQPGRSEPQQEKERPKTVQQKSTFQKFLKGISNTPAATTPDGNVDSDPYGGIGLGEQGCTNCRGKDASVAWDTVGLLRMENKGLKERVGELESAVDDALGVCDGLHL